MPLALGNAIQFKKSWKAGRPWRPDLRGGRQNECVPIGSDQSGTKLSSIVASRTCFVLNSYVRILIWTPRMGTG